MKSQSTFQSSKSAHRIFVLSLFIFIVAQVSAFIAGLVFYPERLKASVDSQEQSTLRFAVQSRQDKAFADKVWHRSRALDGKSQDFLPLFLQSSSDIVKACKLELVDVAYIDFYSFQQLESSFKALLVESEKGSVKALMDRSVLVVRAQDVSLGFKKLNERSFAYISTNFYSSDLIPRQFLEHKFGVLDESFKNTQVFQNPLSMIKALDKKSVDIIALSQDDFYRSLERLGRGQNKYRFLWLSKAYPSHLIAVQKNLSDEQCLAVQEQLEGTFHGESFKEVDFVPLSESSLNIVDFISINSEDKEAI